ncbi:MAG: RNA polymerase sigma factor [Patescibacteria group bacterium]|jgi:RNA polymerase sigma-70 factor (ECF subfamily)
MITKIESSKLTDEELVTLTLADKNNYFYLANRYEEKLSRYIKRLANFSSQDVEDILQDIFIKAYLNLNSFNPKLKFSSWLYRITHNETINHFKKARTRPITLSTEDNELILQFIASDSNIEKEMWSQDDAASIQRTLTKLNKNYRDVIILKYFEDKDYKEISDILRKPMGTVATLLNRAKKSLREEIEKETTETKRKIKWPKFPKKSLKR